MEFEIGSRVRDSEGFRGTVRYIGPVAAAKNKTEPWLGVEWDDATRGKHDGSCVDDKGDYYRYFKCQMGAGSFVKSAKVGRPISLVEALQQRYVAIDAPEITESDSSLPGAFVTTAKGNVKKIEFYGEKKLRKWQQLEVIDKIAVRSDNVASIGSTLGSFASHLVEVDLQDNLMWQWSEVFSLGEQLPNLRNLLLHGNKMQKIDEPILVSLPRSLSSLRLLALNACGISSWAEIQLLEPFVPSLEELYLSENLLVDLPRAKEEIARLAAIGAMQEAPTIPNTDSSSSSLPPHPPADCIPHLSECFVKGFCNLILLDLTRCGLDEWSQVLPFSKLPNLQSLILDGNAISTVEPIVDSETFKSLHRISLSSTQINDWRAINHLGTFPSLRQLRLSHIPLFTGKGASEVRPLVIGRIASINIFNASTISLRERRDAEKSYLREVYRFIKLAAHESPEEDFVPAQILEANPRFLTLREVYASDLASLKGSSVSEAGSISSDLISVGLHFLSISSASSSDGQPVTKKFPSNLTIGRLRNVIKQLFGLDPHLQLLSIRLYKDAVPTVLDDDEATLAYYGADNGSDIFINEAKGASH